MTVADADVDLHCPLCGYSLRGLVDPRCPECGFAFAWAELREAARNKHPYLFEHGAGHNLRTFWLTFWRDCRPRRFWRELSPAHPIRLRRLIVYWLVSNLGLLLLVPAAVLVEAVRQADRNAAGRLNIANVQKLAAIRPNLYPGIRSWTPAALNRFYPPVTTIGFWRNVFTHGPTTSSDSIALIVELLWVGVTFLTLLIFQQSMRRKNIRNAHLVRVAVYCCDYPVLMAILIGLASVSRNYSVMIVIGVLFLITTYRLYFAYARYLRLSFPWLTVLAAQLIVALVMIVLVLNFTREGYRWWMLRW